MRVFAGLWVLGILEVQWYSCWVYDVGIIVGMCRVGFSDIHCVWVSWCHNLCDFCVVCPVMFWSGVRVCLSSRLQTSCQFHSSIILFISL